MPFATQVLQSSESYNTGTCAGTGMCPNVWYGFIASHYAPAPCHTERQVANVSQLRLGCGNLSCISLRLHVSYHWYSKTQLCLPFSTNRDDSVTPHPSHSSIVHIIVCITGLVQSQLIFEDESLKNAQINNSGNVFGGTERQIQNRFGIDKSCTRGCSGKRMVVVAAPVANQYFDRIL